LKDLETLQGCPDFIGNRLPNIIRFKAFPVIGARGMGAQAVAIFKAPEGQNMGIPGF
jgi:hypothetical protein